MSGLSPGFAIQRGFSEAHRDDTAVLFWQAFSGKLGKILAPHDRALEWLRRILDPAFAISAVDESGDLLGLAGFKTSEGALAGGSLADLAGVYGWTGALWRGALLSVTDRDVNPDLLLMDGIFVADHARGRGVGTALLDAIVEEARKRGKSGVRLDVIDTNPRAQALYERRGFVGVSTEETGIFAGLFGFCSALRMERRFAQSPSNSAVDR
ncbi:molybdopterin-guanine dinucleotide biosynthesis protein MobC [Roseibium aquae]|uniref:Molybdopterin-guanine dinucleotide biosynthesis protein MobC n=1 Tax=Roseibium aquae TaxID=1323746 RepID=A0A916TD02_9HYPH|nr:GNAT family N-acetyltransferase [Roseibium aquae]GGB40752.1 molybdopterin-guanine dinucleotide biosynthesis protein MobC [Roseibium aquae]